MPKTRHLAPESEQLHTLDHAERTPAHGHSRGHVVYPASGVLSLITDNGSWIAPPNRAVWIPAGFAHHHRAHGATDMRVVFLDADLAALLPDHPSVLVVTPLAREATLALTSETERTAEAHERLRRVMIDEFVTAAEQPLHLPEPHDDRLRAVARLVEEDLAAPRSLAELGRQVGASERTLTRLFQRETGMTFRQWRTQLRIHHALLLLTDGLPVVDVAVACGWSNPSDFIDAFTALVGETPGRYQRTLRPG